MVPDWFSGPGTMELRNVGPKQMITFWFYESFTQRRSPLVIHASWCRACNDGLGNHQRLWNGRVRNHAMNGRWCGPYDDCLTATTEAQLVSIESTRRTKLCGHCLDI